MSNGSKRERYQAFKLKVKSLCSELGSTNQVVFGEGSVNSKVVIVGFMPEIREESPFTGRFTLTEKLAVESCNVPEKYIYYTYIVKSRPQDKKDAPAIVPLWHTLLCEEIEIVKPKAVIMLGSHVVNAMFGFRGSDVGKYRHTRLIMKSNEGINYFATYSPSQVYAEGGVETDMGQEFVYDHLAVFEGQVSYFDTVQVVLTK